MHRQPTCTILRLLFALIVIPSINALGIPQSTSRLAKNGVSAFNDGKPLRVGFQSDPTGSLYCNGPYGIDTKAGIPFSRANRGKLLFYGKGEGNTPNGVTDQWMYDSWPLANVSFIDRSDSDQGGVDDPKQSACGIPHNAYSISHVAIHPYWLKYASLDSRFLFPTQAWIRQCWSA